MNLLDDRNCLSPKKYFFEWFGHAVVFRERQGTSRLTRFLIYR